MSASPPQSAPGAPARVPVLPACRQRRPSGAPTDVLLGAILGVSVPLLGMRLFVPEESFPVVYGGAHGAHLDLGGARAEAIRRALKEQMSIEVSSIEPFGLGRLRRLQPDAAATGRRARRIPVRQALCPLARTRGGDLRGVRRSPRPRAAVPAPARHPGQRPRAARGVPPVAAAPGQPRSGFSAGARAGWAPWLSSS